MKLQTKQVALKASLLMILAANLSWQARAAYNVSDLASRDPAQELGGNGAAPGRLNLNLKTTPPPAVVVTPAPSKAEGPKPDAPISTASLPTKESTEKRAFCGVEYTVHYVQQVDPKTKSTIVRAYVKSPEFTDRMFSYWDKGTYASLISPVKDSDDSYSVNPKKVRFDELIEKSIRTKYDCAETAVADRDSNKTTDVDKSESSAERIARGVKNCTLDKNGLPLSSKEVKDGSDVIDASPRYRCMLERVQNYSLEKQDDDIDNEGGRRTRRRSENSTQKLAGMMVFLGDRIKALLMSSNEFNRDEGLSRLDDLVAALEDVKSTTDSATDARAIDLTIKQLKIGYTAGSKVYVQSQKDQSSLDEVTENIASIKARMNANPAMTSLLMPSLQNALIQKVNLEQSVRAGQVYTNYNSLLSTGVVPQTDYDVFGSTYKSLLNTLNGVNGTTGQTATAPTDLLNQRQTFSSNNQFGTTLPGVNVNYSQLGLQQPSTSTSTAIPPNFGQSTQFGQPTTFGQAQTTFGQPQQAFGQQFGQQQPAFGQQFGQQQPAFGQQFGQNTQPIYKQNGQRIN